MDVEKPDEEAPVKEKAESDDGRAVSPNEPHINHPRLP